MLFNSLVFLFFFVIVYCAYLISSKSVKIQNIILLSGSYLFYGTWDWRFLFLILLSTLVDYIIGLKLYSIAPSTQSNRHSRKTLLIISICINLGILGFFKYFNFFATSLTTLFSLFGLHADSLTLNIILPVGISFYTFQTMSYTIDIYRGTLKPTKNLLNFALFVAYFPQLVAGPIERAINLLPQIERRRIITAPQVNAALFLILWGYVKKVVIADNLAIIANEIFNHYQTFEGLDIVLGVIAFSIQIYGDFSGYSDIARGISKLMGIELMVNFRLPYFARSPSDFWQRWHISLSSWLRDYLYIPLGGNRKGSLRTNINLFITMLLGGLWHGAAWNFILWGAYHGVLLIAYKLAKNFSPKKACCLPKKYQRPIRSFLPVHPSTSHSSFIHHLSSLLKIFLMFILTLFGWLLFRSSSWDQISYMTSHAGFSLSYQTLSFIRQLIFYATPLVLMQMAQAWSGNLLAPLRLSSFLKTALYIAMLFSIFVFALRESSEFIYFQF